MRIKTIAAVLIYAVALCGCKDSSDEKVKHATALPTETGSGTVVLVESNGTEQFQYRQDIGESAKDVYFIFTNSSASDISTLPTVSVAGSSQNLHSAIRPSESKMESVQDIDLLEYSWKTVKTTASTPRPPSHSLLTAPRKI